MVTPFLPGDSLLFATGALAALGKLNLPLLAGCYIAAATLGDAVNYASESWHCSALVYCCRWRAGVPAGGRQTYAMQSTTPWSGHGVKGLRGAEPLGCAPSALGSPS